VWQQLIKKGTHDRARTRRRLCQLRNSPFHKRHHMAHEGYGGRDNDVRLTALMSYAWMCCG
jgi:hypothetical protein